MEKEVLLKQLTELEKTEKEDEFICFFNFKEPSILLLGEIVKVPTGEIAVFKNTNYALSATLNFVKTKFN